MIYFISIMLTILFLIVGVFQSSLPTVYSVMKNDFDRVVTENSWFAAIKFADLQLRAGNHDPNLGQSNTFTYAPNPDWVVARSEDLSQTTPAPEKIVTNNIAISKNPAGEIFIEVTTDFKRYQQEITPS